MNAVSISRRAEADLDEVWDYVAQDSIGAADGLLGRILEQARLIATQPRMGRPRFELASELRSFPVGEYLLFYRPREPKGIQLVRVLHGRRDITSDLF